MELLGPEYIDIAFRTARAADPHALLAYNEYGVEYDNAEEDARRAATLQLLRRMKAANVQAANRSAVGFSEAAGGIYRGGGGLRGDANLLWAGARGPAAVSGPVNCVPTPQGANVSGPPVKVTVGPGVTNTETIASGNTGAGTWHVASCSRSDGADPPGLKYLG